MRYDLLDGYWQLQEVTDKRNGITTDVKGTLYCSFDCDIVMFGYKNPKKNAGYPMDDYVSGFRQEDDMLYFGPFYQFRNETVPAPTERMALFGLYEREVAFRMSGDSKLLSLESDSSRIIMKKH